MKKVFIFTMIITLIFPAGVFAQDKEIIPSKEARQELTLEQCVKIAIYNSYEVKLAKLDFLIAETDILYSQAVFDTFVSGDVGYIEDKRQQSSVFAPDDTQTNTYSLGLQKKIFLGTEFSASWNDTRNWTNTIFVNKNPYHEAELTLEFEQPLGKNFFGMIDRGNVSITKLTVKNADLETKDRIEAIVSRVEKAYWELVYAKAQRSNRQAALEQANKLLEINTKNYDIGYIEKGDFLASEANVYNRKVELAVAENDYDRAEENLKVLMNVPHDAPGVYPVYDLERKDFKYDINNCYSVAFRKRRDYQIDKRDVEIAGIDLKMKDNERWPEIDIKGTMAMNGLEGKFNKAFTKSWIADNTYYYGGIEVSWPLENSAARSQYQKAQYGKERAITKVKETERQIIADVTVSYGDLVTYKNNVDNVIEAVKLETGKLDEEVTRFKRGRSTTKRLIDYQNDLLAAERRRDLNMLELEKSKIDLERSMNTLLVKYEEIL